MPNNWNVLAALPRPSVFGPVHVVSSRHVTKEGNRFEIRYYLSPRFGDRDETEAVLRREIEIREASNQTVDYELADALTALAKLLKETGRSAEAEALMRRALENAEARHEAGDQELADRIANLAELLKATGRTQEAEGLMRRALEIAKQSYSGEQRLSLALDKAHREFDKLLERCDGTPGDGTAVPNGTE